MSAADPVAVVVPRENVNDESATLVAWSAADGAPVEAGQTLAQVETSKAVLDIVAPAAGTLRHAAKVGQDVAIGGVLGWVGDGSPAPTAPAEVHRNGDANGQAAPGAPLAPSVRRLVAEENVDPSLVKGTGRGGRITKGDVLDHLASPPKNGRGVEGERADTPPPASTRFSRKALERLKQLGLDEEAFEGRGLVRLGDLEPNPEAPAALTAATSAPAAASAAVPASGVSSRREPLSRAKRTEGRYLRSGFETTLASVVTVTCPTRGLRAAAGRLAAIEGNATALVVFEAARLLRKYPAFNAYHHDGAAYYYDEVNVGFAVDAGKGLKVPVVKNADAKGASETASEMRELVVAYLNDSLPVASLAGGTFTVTDLSGEGVTAFHPLINQGQSAILGVCAEVFPGGAREGWFNLVLAFDHQVSEGRAAAKFLGELRDRLAHYESAAPATAVGAHDAEGEPSCARCGTGYRDLAANGLPLLQTVGADGSTRRLCKLCFEGWV